MIHGILSEKAAYEPGKPRAKLLFFGCPKCKSYHCIMVSKERAPEGVRTHPSGAYSIEFWHVWIYSEVGPDQISIEPSFDNSGDCGWHGPSVWDVKVITKDAQIKTLTEEDLVWMGVETSQFHHDVVPPV